MSYEIRVERLLGTTPEVAFHQWVSAEGRKQWYQGNESHWEVEAETDLRVGGTYWVTWGPKTDVPWREEGTFIESNRPPGSSMTASPPRRRARANR